MWCKVQNLLSINHDLDLVITIRSNQASETVETLPLPSLFWKRSKRTIIFIGKPKTYIFSKLFSFWHRSPHCDQDWHQQSKYWASPSSYTSFGKRGLCGQHPIYDPGPIRGKLLQRQWRYACGRPRYRRWSFISGGNRVLWSSLCGQILHYQSTQQSSRLFVNFFLSGPSEIGGV